MQKNIFNTCICGITHKFDFNYLKNKSIHLAKEEKIVVDNKDKYTDQNEKADIKAELKTDLIMLLAENSYPPINKDEVLK